MTDMAAGGVNVACEAGKPIPTEARWRSEQKGGPDDGTDRQRPGQKEAHSAILPGARGRYLVRLRDDTAAIVRMLSAV